LQIHLIYMSLVSCNIQLITVFIRYCAHDPNSAHPLKSTFLIFNSFFIISFTIPPIPWFWYAKSHFPCHGHNRGQIRYISVSCHPPKNTHTQKKHSTYLFFTLLYLLNIFYSKAVISLLVSCLNPGVAVVPSMFQKLFVVVGMMYILHC